MDPQLPKPPAMELPPPQPEQGAHGQLPQEAVSPGMDVPEAKLAQTAEQPGAGLPPVDPSAATPIVPVEPPITPDPALSVPVAGAANPALADDGDLIEKEWVLKAKHIVEKTSHDPHEQSKAVNRVKADYLKKRYQKDLKLNEE